MLARAPTDSDRHIWQRPPWPHGHRPPILFVVLPGSFSGCLSPGVAGEAALPMP